MSTLISLLFAEADIVVIQFSSGTILCKDVRLLFSWYSTVGWNPLQNSLPDRCNLLWGFGQVWELVVLICLQDWKGVREKDNLLAVMIWSPHCRGSQHEGFCFCTVVGALLSNGHACCGFLSCWEEDTYSWPSVGHRVGCWPIGEYMDPCFLWISLSSHNRGEGLLHRVISCVSTREGRDCGMDLDVSCVRYPGLWHVWRVEGECVLRQSVMKRTAVLMHKTSFQSVLGETLQPGFHGMVWHAPELVCLHHNLVVPRSSFDREVGFLRASPFLWSAWTASPQWSNEMPASGSCQGPVGLSLLWLAMLWSDTGDGFWLFPGTLFSVFSRLLPRMYQQVCEEWPACVWLWPLPWQCVVSRSASCQMWHLDMLLPLPPSAFQKDV